MPPHHKGAFSSVVEDDAPDLATAIDRFDRAEITAECALAHLPFGKLKPSCRLRERDARQVVRLSFHARNLRRRDSHAALVERLWCVTALSAAQSAKTSGNREVTPGCATVACRMGSLKLDHVEFGDLCAQNILLGTNCAKARQCGGSGTFHEVGIGQVLACAGFDAHISHSLRATRHLR